MLASKKPNFGWNTIIEPIALVPDADQGINKVGGEPIVVSFYCPPFWLVTKPTINFNGSAGTLAINDFAKGDTGTFFVDQKVFKSKGKTVDEMKKPDFKDVMYKALSQKGQGFIFDLRVYDLKDGTAPGYKECTFDYTIQSEASVGIDRTGMAAFTSKGDNGNMQVMWAAVVSQRWNGMKNDLKEIVDSFRIEKVPKNILLKEKYAYESLEDTSRTAAGFA